MRVISFRHEQNAGNAAAIAGFLTKKPGICLTVSAPGFLNGLTALANATTNCFPMILISGSSEREIVDLQQGDYEEMDQLAIAKPLCKAAFRVLHAADIGIGVARAIRAAVSGRPGGVYLDLPAKLFPQAMDAEAGQEVARQGRRSRRRRQIPAPDAVQRALDLLKSAKRPLIILGKGAAYAQADDRDPRAGREERHPLPADEHGQGPVARHASAVARARRARRAEGRRRRDADRRAPQLAAVARQGQDLGRAADRRSSSRSTSRRREMDSNVEIAAPVVGDIGSCVSALLDGHGRQLAGAAGRLDRRRQRERKDENIAKMAPRADEESGADGLPQRARRRAHHHQGAAGRHPRQRRRQHARLRARRRRHVQAAQAPGRRHLGRHGHRHGLCRRRRRRDRQAGDRGRGRQRLRLLRHGSARRSAATTCRSASSIFNNNGIYRGDRRQSRPAVRIRRPPCSSRTRATTR